MSDIAHYLFIELLAQSRVRLLRFRGWFPSPVPVTQTLARLYDVG